MFILPRFPKDTFCVIDSKCAVIGFSCGSLVVVITEIVSKYYLNAFTCKI